MDRPAQAVRAEATKLLISRLDSRMGNALFIGADLPEVALHVLRRGLFAIVNDSDSSRLEAFMSPIREARLDKQVSIESRPYSDVEFLASSFNSIVAWRGVPDDMPLPLFFKKIRRELKAGAALHLHVALRPARWAPSVASLLSRLPDDLREKLEDGLSGADEKVAGLREKLAEMASPAREWADRRGMDHVAARERVRATASKLRGTAGAIGRRLSLPGAQDPAALRKAAEQYLDVASEIPLSIFAERLMLLPEAVRMLLKKAPLPTLEVAQALDAGLLRTPAALPLASSAIIAFSKTKEFGHVFRIQPKRNRIDR